MGHNAIEIYQSYKLDDADKDNYAMVVNYLKRNLSPTRSLIYERAMFYKADGESFDEFVMTLAKHC